MRTHTHVNTDTHTRTELVHTADGPRCPLEFDEWLVVGETTPYTVDVVPRPSPLIVTREIRDARPQWRRCAARASTTDPVRPANRLQ